MAKKALCEVRESSIHQRGLFATCDINEETDIIQYVGEKISKKESTKRALEWEEKARETGEGLVYIFELDDDYDIDGREGENPARYMNHSCDGNCEAINYEGEIWIVARKDIKKGEELVYDYGYDMEHFLDHPCLCGSDKCIGYIVREDQRNKVRKLLRGKKKKKKGGNKSEKKNKKDKKKAKK
ncbi:MAG TPA: SET domain-containing protein-lysine N-methyltransferase [Opitutae bacterium]|nr:SET domain-containing protein-lysine N-methyltransferase [Opitutae bacterium]